MYCRIARTGSCWGFSGSHIRADNRQPSGIVIHICWIVRVLYGNSVLIFISIKNTIWLKKIYLAAKVAKQHQDQKSGSAQWNYNIVTIRVGSAKSCHWDFLSGSHSCWTCKKLKQFRYLHPFRCQTAGLLKTHRICPAFPFDHVHRWKHWQFRNCTCPGPAGLSGVVRSVPEI